MQKKTNLEFIEVTGNWMTIWCHEKRIMAKVIRENWPDDHPAPWSVDCCVGEEVLTRMVGAKSKFEAIGKAVEWLLAYN